jgi:P-type Cu+ transporter
MLPLEASDVTLVGGELSGVVTAVRAVAQHDAVIRQNLFWAFFYNAVGIPIAAGALYPVSAYCCRRYSRVPPWP